MFKHSVQLPCLYYNLLTFLLIFLQLTYMLGHGGYGGQMAHADPTMKAATAYGTCHLKPMVTTKDGATTRWSNLCTSFYECIYKLEKIDKQWSLLLSGTAVKEYEDKISK